MAYRKKPGWGGPRKGGGRPKGSGLPIEQIRRNRVVVMLTDAELARIKRIAHDEDLPVGTALYEICKRSLRRRK